MASGKVLDFTGKKINNLFVERFSHKTPQKGKRPNKNNYYWVCRCDCGGRKIASTAALSSGNLVSCGCHRIKQHKKWCDQFDPKITVRNNAIKPYKHKAKRLKLLWGLSNEQCYTIFESSCFYCGAGPDNIAEHRGESYKYSGIDRIEPEKGYMWDNVVSCCIRCNWAKSNHSQDKFFKKIILIYNKGRI
jgi:hypothetical protein